MEELTTTQGIVALGAAGVALVALTVTFILLFKLRGLRANQLVVLGGQSRRDLVTHAERLETGFVELREWVEETFARLDERATAGEVRVDGCLARRGLVRYDAWGEMSGRQSVSLALLDDRRSGIVVTSISHRDQARLYFKQVHEGESEVELSPEEQEAVDSALAAPGSRNAPAAR